MIWELIQLVLLIALVIVYAISIYQHNVLLRTHETMMEQKERVIAMQRAVMELNVKERKRLYEDINTLMGETLNLETERDYWKRHALSLQRELYHGSFFEEE